MPEHVRHDGWGWIASLLLVLAFLTTPAHAQTFPEFTGLVVDAANILTPADEAQLTAQLTALQQRNGRQLVVATIPSLEGRDISQYGVALGRAWGVGLKDDDQGAILIVAPNDRKVRVEVGYGLEGVLTDAFSSLVINRQILPAFRDGDLPRGVRDGTAALVEQLSLPDAEARAKLDAAIKAQGREGGRSSRGGFPLPLVFWLIVAAFVLLSMFRGGGGGGGGKGKRFRRRDSSVWVWGPIVADVLSHGGRSGGGGFGGFGGGSSDGGGWMGGGFSGGGGGSFGGGGASGSW